ncbi:hypothetical protein D6C92_09798 [Aureobasidium pullulans]|nr:hypothetical protein D6C92_09798 [Aureobasidium pullulans]
MDSIRDGTLEKLSQISLGSLSKMDHRNRMLTYAYGAFFAVFLLIFSMVNLGHMYLPATPAIRLKYKEPSPFDPRKVALLIENRPSPHLIPLLLHFTAVIPSDWTVNFMGSDESVASVNSSLAVRNQVKTGKMDLTYIPSNMSVAGTEQISAFLTNLWVYETLLAPAEWLLIFQTDSMLCANSEQSLNDWLDYDWVGAPWSLKHKGGGNGGLSLRKVSSIITVLKHQVRLPKSEPEDVWLSNRLSNRVGAKVANGTLENKFSGEMISSYSPMGYHLGGSGAILHGGSWGTPEKRERIYEWCPEVKMILNMDHKHWLPGDCNVNWKRSDGEYWDLTPF